VLEIAEAVCIAAGRDCSSIEHLGDRPGQVAKLIADASRFSARFGWSPKMPFEAGLERTVRWYSENEEWWRKLEWMKVVPVRTASGEVEHH
jgi:dTDP-glucose 4,6-dehydratase